MAVTFTAREISAKYDRFARWFDLVEGIPDLLGVRKLRKRILPQASGEVLEVAVGTGKNLHYYPERCRIIGVDISRSKNPFSLSNNRSTPPARPLLSTVITTTPAAKKLM